MEGSRKGFARQMARKVLKDCGISKPPIDLKLILKEKGYEYIEVDTFMDSVDALFLENEGSIYAAVNSKHHIHRQRFSLAHELGHILLNHNLDYYSVEISLDNPPSEKKHTGAERAYETEANNFAGELLVPLELLKKEFKKNPDLKSISKAFWVSEQVASIAVSNHMSQLYK